MKVIIAGSRLTPSVSWVERINKEICIACACLKITEIVSGGARGVDQIGEMWARNRDIPIKQFIPDWDLHGRGAGPIRNKHMAEYADALVAIWDGKSRGTENMIETMRRLGKLVCVRLLT